MDRDYINLFPNSYFRQREEYVQKHHKNLFIKPLDFYYKSNLYFDYPPSTPIVNKTLNHKTIFAEESNNSKERSKHLFVVKHS